MSDYIHLLPDWPRFHWDAAAVGLALGQARHNQGHLLGRLEALGFELRAETVLESLTEEVVKSSEIEGERLDRAQVRSSIAQRLGMDIGALVPADRNVDGIVEMMLDATQNYGATLTEQRLFDWHAALFPTGRSGMTVIKVGAWRTSASGPMQVVSGPIGRERIHFVAPSADRVPAEMRAFLSWFNAPIDTDPVIFAAIAHFWFVTIHPFEDGNGRIARAIADMALARSEKTPRRFYSMSSQIRIERDVYYDTLERTQKGDLDITNWLAWFLHCLDRALARAEKILASSLRASRFWTAHANDTLNNRQQGVVRRLFGNFEGKLTTSKYAALTKSSQDTAARDIDDLCRKKIFVRDPAGGRSTSYSLVASSADAIAAVARYIFAHADKTALADQAIPSLEDRQAKIEQVKAIGEHLADLARNADARIEYSDFERQLAALHALQFFPAQPLVDAVAYTTHHDL